MAIPINEVSLFISIVLALFWAVVKFSRRRTTPQAEDVVDLIALLFLGPVFVVGAIFIAISLGILELSILEIIKTNVGISGAILVGAGLYFFYVTLQRDEEQRKLAEAKKVAVKS